MLRLPPFKLRVPASVEEAAAILAGEGADARLVAGGTDLWPNMKRRHQKAGTVVSLMAIPELRGVENGGASGEIRLGGTAILDDLARDERLRTRYPALVRAIASISSPPLRNMGTIGGNVCVDTRCTYYNQTEEWRRSIDFCMKEEGTICWVAPSSPRCWAHSASDSAPHPLRARCPGRAGVDRGAPGDPADRALPRRRDRLPRQAGRTRSSPASSSRPRATRRPSARRSGSSGGGARSDFAVLSVAVATTARRGRSGRGGEDISRRRRLLPAPGGRGGPAPRRPVPRRRDDRGGGPARAQDRDPDGQHRLPGPVARHDGRALHRGGTAGGRRARARAARTQPPLRPGRASTLRGRPVPPAGRSGGRYFRWFDRSTRFRSRKAAGVTLDQLVVLDELERLLQVEQPRGNEPHELVRTRRPHVGELLLFRDVDVEVARPVVLPHDHPLVHLLAGADEERAARLEVLDGVGGGAPRPVRDQSAGRPVLDLAVPRIPSVEQVVEDAGPACVGQELRAEPDEPARGESGTPSARGRCRG